MLVVPVSLRNYAVFLPQYFKNKFRSEGGQLSNLEIVGKRLNCSAEHPRVSTAREGDKGGVYPHEKMGLSQTAIIFSHED